MKQNSLIDEGEKGCDRRAVASVGVAGSASTLTLLQKRFSKLVARLTARRAEIALGRSFCEAYDQHIAQEYQPLLKRVREVRIAMVMLLDRPMPGPSLGKQLRAKVRDILLDFIDGLLAKSFDEARVPLHDKFADFTIAQKNQRQLQALRELSSETFGVDVAAYTGTST